MVHLQGPSVCLCMGVNVRKRVGVFAWLYFCAKGKKPMTRRREGGTENEQDGWDENGRRNKKKRKMKEKKNRVEMEAAVGISVRPMGEVRLQMYTQCSGAQAKGWIAESCCCFCRAARCSSLCASFCSVPRAAIQRRSPCGISHPQNNTVPPTECHCCWWALAKKNKNTQRRETPRGTLFISLRHVSYLPQDNASKKKSKCFYHFPPFSIFVLYKIIPNVPTNVK